MKLFQTKIKFLGLEIYHGKITPTKRVIEFEEKFPNELKDNNQLQRFLGSLNYVSEFIPNIRIFVKPLFQILKKNPPPWNEEMTKIVQEVKNK